MIIQNNVLKVNFIVAKNRYSALFNMVYVVGLLGIIWFGIDKLKCDLVIIDWYLTNDVKLILISNQSYAIHKTVCIRAFQFDREFTILTINSNILELDRILSNLIDLFTSRFAFALYTNIHSILVYH